MNNVSYICTWLEIGEINVFGNKTNMGLAGDYDSNRKTFSTHLLEELLHFLIEAL